MNDVLTRLKAARKKLKMNQTEFAKNIGMSQGGYGQVETGVNGLSERVLKLICGTYNISEHWLRTGEGEMFVDNTDALVKRLQEDMGMSGSEIELLQTFLSFPAGEREQVISFGRRFAARFAHDDEPDADEAARLHAQLDAELQAEREAASASSATSSEKKA